MRKLSKKISMLMVLAMLVSLFSGIVSASAASSWSFYDRTAEETVERNATYVMEKDQYANFDLYKDGAEASTKEYKYTWYSDDASVVYVDSTNGRLRAQKDAEAGEKAFVYVLIDNKTTEKNENAKRGFYIEIAADEVVEEVDYKVTANIGQEVYLTGEKYELEAVVTADGEEIEADVVFSIDGVAIEGAYAPTKAGEYTIVVTATIDGEEYAAEYPVVVEENRPEIVEAKQTALNTVVITFNNADWAKEFASKVKLSYFAGDVEIADLVKSAVAKDETVTVTLYNNLATDVTYKFACEEHDCAATVKGAKLVPASIKVVGGNVAAQAEGQLGVKFYTVEGIDITTDALKVQVQYSGTDESVSVVAGDKIYFFEAGKSAVVNAKYDMGYDENGNKIADLTASGLYYSVPAYTDSNLNGYAMADAGATQANLSYGNNIIVSLSDTVAPAEKYLYAKYTRTYADGHTDPVYVLAGGYKYYSTNESVLLVEELSGKLTACSEGVASVFIKNANNAVVGSVTVNVKGARTLTTFTASLTDRMISASDSFTTDYTTVAVSTKDQLGNYIAADWNVELVNPAGDLANYLAWETVTNNGQVTGIKLTPNVANIDATKVQVVSFKITASKNGVNKTWNGSVSIKNVNTVNPSSTVLDLSAASVDMKLNKGGVNDYDVTVKLVKKDAAGYDLGLQSYTYINSEAAAVTGPGVYSIFIKKNSNNAAMAADGSFIVNADDKITFNPVTGDALVAKTAKETYTIKVFKGNGTKAQLYATKTVSFTDSTSAITVVVNKTNIDGTDGAAVKASVDFYRGTTKITDKITSVEVIDKTNVVDGKKVYVKKVRVTVLNKEMNNNFAGSHTEDVVINQLFVAP